MAGSADLKEVVDLQVGEDAQDDFRWEQVKAVELVDFHCYHSEREPTLVER